MLLTELNSRGRKEIFKIIQAFNRIVTAGILEQLRIVVTVNQVPSGLISKSDQLGLNWGQGQGQGRLDMPCKELGFGAKGDVEVLRDLKEYFLSVKTGNGSKMRS